MEISAFLFSISIPYLLCFCTSLYAKNKGSFFHCFPRSLSAVVFFSRVLDLMCKISGRRGIVLFIIEQMCRALLSGPHLPLSFLFPLPLSDSDEGILVNRTQC